MGSNERNERDWIRTLRTRYWNLTQILRLTDPAATERNKRSAWVRSAVRTLWMVLVAFGGTQPNPPDRASFTPVPVQFRARFDFVARHESCFAVTFGLKRGAIERKSRYYA